MSKLLKNCPHCGGILDDDGRCVYCKSKVYDLTDIKIDMNSRDILVMKLKYGDDEVIMNCYPANVTIKTEPDYCFAERAIDGVYHMPVMRRRNTTVELELVQI